MPNEPVYLHVGPPKTGTTYLQEFLWSNRRALADAGVLYPGDRPGRQFKAVLDLRGTGFAGNEIEGVSGSWARISEQVQEWTGRSVISHEIMAALTHEQAQRAMDSLVPHPVHVVLTLRDFSRIVPATWQETAKNRFVESWAEFLDRVRPREHDRDRNFWSFQNVPGILRMWADLVPVENIHVVTVPPPGAPRSLLLERFAEVLGFDPAAFQQDVKVPNESIGTAEVALLHRVNDASRDRLSWPAYHQVIKHDVVPRVLAVRPGATRVLLPDAETEWVRAETERTMKAIRELGLAVAGDLDDLGPHPMPGQYVDPDQASTAEQADVGAAVIVDLAARLHDNMGELKKVREELRSTRQALDAARGEVDALRHELAERDVTRVEHLKRRVVRFGRRHRSVEAALDAYRRMRRSR